MEHLLGDVVAVHRHDNVLGRVEVAAADALERILGHERDGLAVVVGAGLVHRRSGVNEAHGVELVRCLVYGIPLSFCEKIISAY